MALGQQLLEARRQRNLTASEVAAGTRVKVQLIEAMEREDFSKFAAPIYGKGFIKLYAEYVGLDPRPLIDEYMSNVSAPETPLIAADADILDTEQSQQEIDDERRPGGDFDLFNETGDVETDAPPVPPPAAGPPRRNAFGEGMRSAAQSVAAVFIRIGAVAMEVMQTSRMRLTEIGRERDPWKLLPLVAGIIVVLVFILSGFSRCIRRPTTTDIERDTASDRMEIAVDIDEPYLD